MKYCNNYPGLTYPKSDDEVQGILKKPLEQIKPVCEEFYKVLMKQTEYHFPKQNIFSRTGAVLSKGILNGITSSMGKKWVVKTDKCIKCLNCVNICPEACFDVVNGVVQFTHGERCIGCNGCFMNCPKKAIMDPKGKWETCPQYHFEEYQFGDTDKFYSKEELKRRNGAKNE